MIFNLNTVLAALAISASTLAAPIRRAGSPADILVFQFAGVLERLETEFYAQALQKFQDADFTAAGFGNVNVPKEVFSTILRDEASHTSIIESTIVSLGAQPITTCQFNFGDALKDVATMAATARVVENVGVSAYLGGANLLENKELLIAAGSILTVEARHQSVLNILNTATSVPSAFDIALSPSQILAIAGSFISGCDLGIPALPPLAITNTGKVAPGTLLTFDSPAMQGVDPSGLTCQMMVGGAPLALSLPLADCVVPEINGPVYIFIVNGTQPLLNSQTNQFAESIVAGPTLAFIDTIPETLGQVVKAAPAQVSSVELLTGDQANALLNSSGPITAEPAPAAGGAVEVISASTTASAAAATQTGVVSNGQVEVLGWSTVSASSASAGGASSSGDAGYGGGYY